MKRRDFIAMVPSLTALSTTNFSSKLEFTTENLVITKIPLHDYFPNHASGLRIGFIADIHDGPFMSDNFYHGVFSALEAEKPDLLLFGGDYLYLPTSISATASGLFKGLNPIFDGLSQYEKTELIIRRLEKRLSKFKNSFLVYGNHDKHNLFSSQIESRISNFLINKSTRIYIKGVAVELYGTDDFLTGFPSIPSLSDNYQTFRIILSHNPDYFDYFNCNNFHLGVSGHTHWGQIKLPLVGAPTYHVHTTRYCEGLVHDSKVNSVIYTTSGIGTVEIPYRIGVKPEIVIFEL